MLEERWRREYNQQCPHSTLAYKPPALQAKFPRSQALALLSWSGLQSVPGHTWQVASLASAGQYKR